MWWLRFKTRRVSLLINSTLSLLEGSSRTAIPFLTTTFRKSPLSISVCTLSDYPKSNNANYFSQPRVFVEVCRPLSRRQLARRSRSRLSRQTLLTTSMQRFRIKRVYLLTSSASSSPAYPLHQRKMMSSRSHGTWLLLFLFLSLHSLPLFVYVLLRSRWTMQDAASKKAEYGTVIGIGEPPYVPILSIGC